MMKQVVKLHHIRVDQDARKSWCNVAWINVVSLEITESTTSGIRWRDRLLDWATVLSPSHKGWEQSVAISQKCPRQSKHCGCVAEKISCGHFMRRWGPKMREYDARGFMGHSRGRHKNFRLTVRKCTYPWCRYITTCLFRLSYLVMICKLMGSAKKPPWRTLDISFSFEICGRTATTFEFLPLHDSCMCRFLCVRCTL